MLEFLTSGSEPMGTKENCRGMSNSSSILGNTKQPFWYCHPVSAQKTRIEKEKRAQNILPGDIQRRPFFKHVTLSILCFSLSILRVLLLFILFINHERVIYHYHIKCRIRLPVLSAKNVPSQWKISLVKEQKISKMSADPICAIINDKIYDPAIWKGSWNKNLS